MNGLTWLTCFSAVFTFQGAFTQINCSSPLYIGGVPEYDKTKRTAGVIKPFTGIIQQVIAFFRYANISELGHNYICKIQSFPIHQNWYSSITLYMMYTAYSLQATVAGVWFLGGFFYSHALSFCPFPLCALFFSPPQLILNDRTIPITTGTAGGVNVANSAHPCVESPCANGGTCRPKWDGYECDCPLGYDGRHCQKGLLHVELFSSTDELGWWDCAICCTSLSQQAVHTVLRIKYADIFYMLNKIFCA